MSAPKPNPPSLSIPSMGGASAPPKSTSTTPPENQPPPVTTPAASSKPGVSFVSPAAAPASSSTSTSSRDSGKPGSVSFGGTTTTKSPDPDAGPPTTPFSNQQTTQAGHTPFPGSKTGVVETPESASNLSTRAVQGTPYTIGNTPRLTSTPGPSTRMAGQTPYSKTVATPGLVPEPQSAQKAAIVQTMRNVATTLDDTKPGATPELRLSREVTRLEREKAMALEQVTQLQTQVFALKNNSCIGDGNLDWQGLIEMAESQGDAAALEWAREQASNGGNGVSTPTPKKKSVGFFSPATPRAHQVARRYRQGTPHPKRGAGMEMDRELLVKATQQTIHEYHSDDRTVSYTIRRPYGIATERDLWLDAGQLPRKMYEQGANVLDSSSLEVIALVAADGSQLVVYESNQARFQKGGREEWKDLGPVELDNAPLGSIMYIDREANEKSYSLDELYYEACQVRAYYSAAVQTMASALERGVNLEPDSNGVPGSLPHDTSPPRTDVQLKETGMVTDPVPKEKEPKKKKKSTSPTVPDEPRPSLIGNFVSSLFSLVYFIFIGIPFRILTTSFVMVVAFVLVSILRLYVADDNGMGAIMFPAAAESNRPGIL